MKLGISRKKVLLEIEDEPDIPAKLVAAILVLVGRYGVGLAMINNKHWGLYTYWQSCANGYTNNLLRSQTFGCPQKRNTSACLEVNVRVSNN